MLKSTQKKAEEAGEKTGISYSIKEARAVVAGHQMDQYHADIMLWLCEENEKLQRALAGKIFDGESLSTREEIRSELIKQGFEAAEELEVAKNALREAMERIKKILEDKP